MLKPFFSYYGSKYLLSKYYAQPKHKTIIEPFAGSAAYSLRYPHKNIVLCDLNEDICLLWQYLINVSEKEIYELPLLNLDDHLDDLRLCSEAKILIGFWLRFAVTTPRKTMSKTLYQKQINNQTQCNTWSNPAKKRIIKQLKHIRHWTIKNCDYRDISNQTATWFVDPPYQQQGKYYKYNKINYEHLGHWCKERQGQVIVCEQFGADWLPFKSFRALRNNNNVYKREAIYTQNCDEQLSLMVI